MNGFWGYPFFKKPLYLTSCHHWTNAADPGRGGWSRLPERSLLLLIWGTVVHGSHVKRTLHYMMWYYIVLYYVMLYYHTQSLKMSQNSTDIDLKTRTQAIWDPKMGRTRFHCNWHYYYYCCCWHLPHCNGINNHWSSVHILKNQLQQCLPQIVTSRAKWYQLHSCHVSSLAVFHSVNLYLYRSIYPSSYLCT